MHTGCNGTCIAIGAVILILLAALPSSTAAVDSVAAVAVQDSTQDMQCKVLRLKNAPCEAAAAYVNSMFHEKNTANKITAVPQLNVVLLRAPSAELEHITFFLQELDAPELQQVAKVVEQMKAEVFSIRHAAASELIEVLKPMLSVRSGSSVSRHAVATDERTNAIVMYGTEEKVDRARTLIQLLDVPLDRSVAFGADNGTPTAEPEELLGAPPSTDTNLYLTVWPPIKVSNGDAYDAHGTPMRPVP